MSTAFTPPANATWQTLLSEIALACRERMGALPPYRGRPSPWVLEDDRDVQFVGYWTALQHYTENAAIKYVDHINGPFSTHPDTGVESVAHFSLATFREAAGLNALGFRRATEWDGIVDPEWSYGFMQVGDIIGPWIFEDLQKALGILKWTVHPVYRAEVQEKAASGSATTIEEALNIARANWAAASWDAYGQFPWQSPTYGAKASADLRDYYPYLGSYGYWGARSRGKLVVKDIFTEVPCTAEVYGLSTPTFGFGENFFDIDLLGMVYGKYFNIQNFPESTLATRTTAMLGDITVAPFDITPFTVGKAAQRSCLWDIGCTIALLKWNFTNE